jgi:hypothetical protein
MRNSQKEREKVAFPYIKKDWMRVTNPQGIMKIFPGFLSLGEKNAYLKNFK